MTGAARFFWIDAFTQTPFGGNPAAVCLTDEELPETVQQGIARELNLSETVFIRPEGSGFAIRWFTPTKEVPLVGHATLAAAYAILALLEPDRASVVFMSPASGSLSAYRDGERLAIELPADWTLECAAPTDLVAGLGATPVSVRVGRHYVALFPDARAVAALRPDFVALARLTPPTIIATAPGEGCDYVLRFFAPANGVPEDPVSGVAQCSLVPFWSAQLGRERLVSNQLSVRGGCMHCRLQGDRVVISGTCRPICEGTFDVTVTSGGVRPPA